VKIEETFSVKQEETEEQTGWFHSQSRTHLMLLKMSIYRN